MPKLKALLSLVIIVLFQFTKAQNITFYGNLKQDSTQKNALPNTLLMLIKFKDSTLINHSRSNLNGVFKPIKVPLDTYIVVVANPSFNDKTYLIVPSVTDTVFNIKNIVLPPKSVELKEVEVLAYRDKMYYKGDTLQFTADSFITKPNATVEDLLKKLPGMKVDATGKITIQGKEVDQVLVDGDEFFGSDPTSATRNLNANTVETIQVFEKKNENSESTDETVKVVNLKLKEDAKKGYFGKASAASDFQKFYEGELLFNRFKKQKKISVFGLTANTPKSNFNWQDNDKFGLDNEQPWSYNEETGGWQSNGSQTGTGIPKTLKTGIYYNDKIGKNTKYNFDYTYNNGILNSGSETNNQFFLEDTSYTNKQVVNNFSNNQAHTANAKVNFKLDSLTEVNIKPHYDYSEKFSNNYKRDEFISSDDKLTRSTEITNKRNGYSTNYNLNFRVFRKFMKKNRELNFAYKPDYSNSLTNSTLQTDFTYFNNQLPNKLLLQKRTELNTKQQQDVSINYIEPLTKKFKLDLNYQFIHTLTNNNRNTLDKDSIGADILNPLQSNNFANTRILHRAMGKLIYDVKKYRFSLGTAYRNITLLNNNITTNINLSKSFNFILPTAGATFRFNQGSNLNLRYTASASPPSLQQLQPVIDNTDPNRIVIGNPNLKPTYNNNVNIDYYFWKGISEVSFYTGANYNNSINQVANISSYDSYGKVTSEYINVQNGNFYSNLWFGGGFPIFKKFLKIDYNLSSNFSNNINYINAQRNEQQNLGINPSLNFIKEKDNYQIRFGGSYSYNLPKSQINSLTNQPYYTYDLNANIYFKLPKNFNISSDAVYTNNGNRANGYNINYVIWNATLNKTFLKNENLIVAIEANDILNQNINNQRTVYANQITDTKTQIIKRFILLRLTYKFNSQKTKENDEDEMD
jgi:hypothetical protein